MQSSGVCDTCLQGYYGLNCDYVCSYCSDYDFTQTGECYKCYPGFYACPSKYSAIKQMGPLFGPVVLHGMQTILLRKFMWFIMCKQGLCEIKSGYCVECNYVDFCNTTCSSECSTNGCERQTGSCTGCMDETSITCTTNCRNQLYSQENSHCTNGCIPTYYGTKCDNVCSEKCADSTTELKCDSKGKCSNGCYDGFIGDTCTM
ncbi:hypothetical protein MAR_030650, partial [Mya arenaria]